MSTEPQAVKTRKGRSPNYPGIDLEAAMRRAETLWENEQHHAIPYELIYRHWDYAPKSGPGSVTYAALKRFGLLEETGDGRARLTDLAQKILLAARDGSRDDARIREAALLPKVHRRLWDDYGANLPSDEHLKYNLVRDMGFTPGGASEFLKQWKRTMMYARLSNSSGTVTGDGGELDRDEDQELTPPQTIEREQDRKKSPPPPPPSANRSTRTVQVTYSPTEWALLQASFPMSEEDWDAMIAVLNAMKRGLVTAPRSTESS
jgi:hypothetical protein